MFYSIIIPVQNINDYIIEASSRLKALDKKNFEVLIFPDTLGNNNDELERTLGAKIVASGKVSPATKRDMALRFARGDILAFLDDDAYPQPDWLSKASPHFHNPEVAAVGGPGITPPHESFWQRVSGAVFLSSFGGGNPERYWPVGKVREVDDWPSVNLLVQRDIFAKIGGFQSAYWPGEDTKLCLDIIKTGKKIIYDPDVRVWHHRRKGLLRHLKQVGRYGLHRGYFANVLPENSRKFKYFIPSLWMIFLILGISFAFFDSQLLKIIYLSGVFAYILALLTAFFQIQLKEKNILISSVSLGFIVLTHLWYGARFLQGYFLKNNLKSKLRPVSEV